MIMYDIVYKSSVTTLLVVAIFSQYYYYANTITMQNNKSVIVIYLVVGEECQDNSYSYHLRWDHHYGNIFQPTIMPKKSHNNVG